MESKVIHGQLFERQIEEELNLVRFEPLAPLKQMIFPDHTPIAILQRWRHGARFTLAATEEAFQFDPLQTILSSDTVMDALHTFKYIRTDAEVQISLTSVPATTGMIAVCADPAGCITGNNISYLDAKSSILSHDPFLIDVATQQQIFLTVPWISPAAFLPIDKLAAGVFQPCAFAMYHTDIADISSPVSTNTIVVTLKFRCANPSVSGFITGNTMDVIEAQSGLPVYIQDNAAAATSTTMRLLTGASAVAFGSTATWLGGKAWEVGTTLGSRGLAVTGGVPENEERDNVTQMKQSIFGDLVGNREVVYPLGLTSLAATPNTPLRDVLRKPSYFGSGSLDTIGDSFLVHPAGIFSIGDEIALSRLQFYNHFFRFWRGSISFFFRFISSPLISYKVGFNVGFGAPELGVEQEDIISRCSSVRGTTDVCVNVPFLHPYQWGRTQTTTSAVRALDSMWLTIRLIDPPVTTCVPEVFVPQWFCWQLAGPDFQFSGLKDFNPVNAISAQSAVSVLAVAGESPLFEGMELPRPVDMIDTMYVEDICRRYSSMAILEGDEELTSWIPGFLTLGQRRSNISYVGTNFLFSRGQIDWKVRFPSDAFDQMIFLDGGDDPVATGGTDLLEHIADGAVKINPAFGNIVQFSTPFYCMYELVQHNDRGNPLVIDYDTSVSNYPSRCYGMLRPTTAFAGDTSPTPTALYLKAGKGFGLYYELPPLPRKWYPTYTFPPVIEKNSRHDCHDDTISWTEISARLGRAGSKEPGVDAAVFEG